MKGAHALSISVLALFLSSLASTLTLSDIQPISGFPENCTSAYNQNLAGCDATGPTDPAQLCTPDCQSSLAAAGALIQSACAGSSAGNSTLIEQFMLGNGPSVLCNLLPAAAVPTALSTVTMTTVVTAVVPVTSLVWPAADLVTVASTKTVTATAARTYSQVVSPSAGGIVPSSEGNRLARGDLLWNGMLVGALGMMVSMWVWGMKL